MAVLKVARLGHPVIRGKTDQLSVAEIKSPEVQQLIDHMIETIRDYDGVGLAATQIHIAKQIAVIEVKDNLRYPDMESVPLTVLINPRISNRSKKIVEGWEGLRRQRSSNGTDFEIRLGRSGDGRCARDARKQRADHGFWASCLHDLGSAQRR